MKKKHTQYIRILSALHKAGHKGMTTLELMTRVGSTCIHKRVAEMSVWHRIGPYRYYLSKTWRMVNSRRVRVYQLVRG